MTVFVRNYNIIETILMSSTLRQCYSYSHLGIYFDQIITWKRIGNVCTHKIQLIMKWSLFPATIPRLSNHVHHNAIHIDYVTHMYEYYRYIKSCSNYTNVEKWI